MLDDCSIATGKGRSHQPPSVRHVWMKRVNAAKHPVQAAEGYGVVDRAISHAQGSHLRP